jgi:DNA-binding FadR family transcriptional regulator
VTAAALGIPAENVDAAAQIYVDALAARDALTPEDAARAAGARTPEQITALAARIRAQRVPARNSA